MIETPLIEIAKFRNKLTFEIDVENDRVIVKHNDNFAMITGDIITNFFMPSVISKELRKVENKIDAISKPNLTQFIIDFKENS